MTAAARSPTEAAGTIEEPVYNVPPRAQLGAEFQSWRELFLQSPLRDPFALASVARPSILSTNAPIQAPAFALQAVSIEPGRARAVIDRRVVGAGETLGEYQVERIQANEVWMKGPAGRIILRLHGGPASRLESRATHNSP